MKDTFGQIFLWSYKNLLVWIGFTMTITIEKITVDILASGIEDGIRNSTWDGIGVSLMVSIEDGIGIRTWDGIGVSLMASIEDDIWSSTGDGFGVSESDIASIDDGIWNSTVLLTALEQGFWARIWVGIGDGVRASIKTTIWTYIELDFAGPLTEKSSPGQNKVLTLLVVIFQLI